MQTNRSRRRVVWILPAAVLSIATGGCTAIGGSQRPVTTTDLTKSDTTSVCPTKGEIADFNAAPPGEKAAIRDGVIIACVKAIDANYRDFKVGLHQESAVTNLVADIAALGLTTGASLAKGKTAQRLAAGGAFAIGSAAAVNKDVFYQQTLPAIEASMDARRDHILTQITEAQNSDPLGTSFSVTDAGILLGAYERAGDIYAAIGELTRNATDKAQEEKSNLVAAQAKDIGLFVPIDPSLKADFRALVVAINALKDNPVDRARLNRVAAKLKISLNNSDSFEDQRGDVAARLRGAVGLPKVDDQRKQIEDLKTLIR